MLLQSLKILKNLSINFVFTPVPDVTEVGMTKVRNVWKSLQKNVNTIKNENDESAEWREKEKRYKFADIYVYGFDMIRKGTV
ncbi:MAG: hypothetical protein PUP92_02150 [Rhizonema sp. PD38]|nr:hypothetical protein [Rhizonema sp. PD38]